MPDDGWEQSVLKEAWNSFPGLREQALRIASISVQKREFTKMPNENGPAEFVTFRDMVKSANKGPSGSPTITVEAADLDDTLTERPSPKFEEPTLGNEAVPTLVPEDEFAGL